MSALGQKRTWLLNDFVSYRQNAGRDGQPKRLGGLEIDYKLKLGRLLHRKFGWFGAFENSASVHTRLAISARDAS
jgi:hypothetical protein